MLGGEASGIGANLTPFLTQEMLHPQGIRSAGSVCRGSRGYRRGWRIALSAFQGASCSKSAGASRNGGAFQAALDDASRNAGKASAGASEGIAANNEGVKLQQQSQQGASGLGSMYNTDTSGMLNAMNQEHQDINSEIAASQAGPGWLSTLNKGVWGCRNGIAKLGWRVWDSGLLEGLVDKCPASSKT